MHENVLEQLFAQHEPDAAAFIEVSQQVYDDIDKNKLFEALRLVAFNFLKFCVAGYYTSFFGQRIVWSQISRPY